MTNAAIKPVPKKNKYKVQFELTAGEAYALKNALEASRSAVASDVAAYLRNAIRQLPQEHQEALG